MDELTVIGIEIDPRLNVLHLTFERSGDDRGEIEAQRQVTIDIGAGGRLLGIELGDDYALVMPPEPGTESMSRSADAEVTAVHDRASGQLRSIILPRAGAGYEITYPSGNQ